MLTIERRNGKTTSYARCDRCNEGAQWRGMVDFEQMEAQLRNIHGWKIGDEHICWKCADREEAE